jgi:hypothetical protein
MRGGWQVASVRGVRAIGFATLALAWVLVACDGGDGAADGARDAMDVPADPGDGDPDVGGIPDTRTDILADVSEPDHDGAEDAPETDACVPHCPAMQECGDDGCGGSCGECWEGWCEEGWCVHVDYEDCTDRECGLGPIFGASCGECEDGFACDLRNRCVPVCDWDTQKPLTWGPAALVESIAFMPADRVADECHDYTGDGTGDASSVGVVATLLTGDDSGGAIVPDPPRALVMEGYGSPQPDPSFRIDVLAGVVQAPAGPEGTPPAEFQVAVDSYDTSSCLPRSTLPNPVYGDATLWAGPGPLRLKIRFRDEDFSTDLLLVDFHARGIFIGATVDEGFRVPDASVSGVVTKDEMFAVINDFQTVCDNAPEGQEPEACAYLSTAKAMVTQQLDFHRADDGTISRATSDLPANAMVVCLEVDAGTPARVTGYAP